MKSLIVQTDPASRSSIRKCLEKCGECELAVNGSAAIDAFLQALKNEEPYQLVCLDVTAPKVDGIKALKAIRGLEKQFGVALEKCARVMMTATSDEARLIWMDFDYGCEIYVVKPINTQKIIEALERLELIDDLSVEAEADCIDKNKNTAGSLMRKNRQPSTLFNKIKQLDEGYFKSVDALQDYQLRVGMGTGTTIHFDFRTRLNTARFGTLRDKELFQSVHTDGNHLIFDKTGKMTVKITAAEFMDLVLIDRTAIE